MRREGVVCGRDLECFVFRYWFWVGGRREKCVREEGYLCGRGGVELCG